MKDTLEGPRWPCERIYGTMWKLWEPRLCGSVVLEADAQGGMILRQIGKYCYPPIHCLQQTASIVSIPK
jgi:hypothetical protein